MKKTVSLFQRNYDGDRLVRDEIVPGADLSSGAIEGVVWHHPDGRMVKIKGKDFDIKRKPSNATGEPGRTDHD